MPAIHAGMTVIAFSFSVGERKIMNHFVVRVYFSNTISVTNV